MNRGPILVAIAVACLAALGAAFAVASRASGPPPGVAEQAVHSRALDGALHFGVWVPRGYADHPRRHYPVVYALHGLPGDETAYRSLYFLVPTLERMNAQAIVVFPQGATSDDSDAEYRNLGPGRGWATALTQELPAAVAHRYRALDTRAARAIMGVSAGGYGAMILGLHNLDRYRVIESWSGYFHATTPDGTAPMQFARPTAAAAADAHRVLPIVAPTLRSRPTLLAFYTGNADPYPGFTAENRQFDRELTAAGVPHRFAVYRGGHDDALWLAHAQAWLGMALHALAPAAG